jgi:drug/metabolite transporter (DMT)-like permease
VTLLSILYGLSSALIWGAGDFTGGIASRRADPYRTVVLSEIIGLLLLLAAALLTGAPFASWPELGWSAAAGALGCSGLVMLYKSFADGKMSTAAPVSALTSVALPIVTGSFLEGLPGALKFAGFGLAAIAIWLISKDHNAGTPARLRLADLRLPLLSGLFFGLYFILMDRGTQSTVLWPMIASRSAGAVTIAVYVLFLRGPLLPPRRVWPLISLNALLDIGGNAFYVLAARAGRMDVAAVLGSLYPGSTVLLAWLLLREKISRLQFIGILTALVAIALMTL